MRGIPYVVVLAYSGLAATIVHSRGWGDGTLVCGEIYTDCIALLLELYSPITSFMSYSFYEYGRSVSS